MRVHRHIFSEHNRVLDFKPLSNLNDAATPIDTAGICQFLGLLNFKQEYIPRYKNVIAPLEPCNCKDVEVSEVWQDNIHFAVSAKPIEP